jgi:hypothetical protein
VWPVIVAHGMTNVLARLDGPCTFEESFLATSIAALLFLIYGASLTTGRLYLAFRAGEASSRHWSNCACAL